MRGELFDFGFVILVLLAFYSKPRFLYNLGQTLIGRIALLLVVIFMASRDAMVGLAACLLYFDMAANVREGLTGSEDSSSELGASSDVPAPASNAPASDAPASDAPASDAPASDAPASDAPASDASAPTPSATTPSAPTASATTPSAPTASAPATPAPATPAPTPFAPIPLHRVLLPLNPMLL
jgi:cytoskeletal protein RodZ